MSDATNDGTQENGSVEYIRVVTAEKLHDWMPKLKEFTWKREVDGTLVVTGQCPYCGYAMSLEFPVIHSYMRSADKGISIVCKCDHAHPGRPESKKTGCGFRIVGTPVGFGGL